LNICPVVGARVGPDRRYFEFGARHWLLRLTKSAGVRSSGNQHKSSAEAQTSRAPIHSEFSQVRQR
jgi:hypothetical protein